MICTNDNEKTHFKVIECSENFIHVAGWAGDLSNGDKNCYHRNYSCRHAISLIFLQTESQPNVVGVRLKLVLHLAAFGYNLITINFDADACAHTEQPHYCIYWSLLILSVYLTVDYQAG